MYSGRHRDDRLFRRTERLTYVLATVGAVAFRERHLPAHTARRVGGAAAMVLCLVAAPVLVPVSVPGRIDPQASATTIGADLSAPGALPPGSAAGPGTPQTAPALRPPMGATGLMTAPPLPGLRAHAGRALLLTFDDGPHAVFTPQILALLAAYDARAVFCVVGRQAQRHPELIRAIVAAGHDLCNHTTHHDEDIALKPGIAVRGDLATTQSILRGITGGLVPRYMRAPGGRWSPTLLAEARVLGLEPLGWSVDPRDWSSPGLRHIVDTVLREAAPGGVAVLHDGGGNRAQTVLALGFLLRRLRQLGYQFR